MKVVTVINDENNKMLNVLSSLCKKHNLALQILISNERPFNNRTKDKLLLEFISNMDDDEIILFTDGSDAIIVADEEEILSKFYEFKSDLVFSAEVNCWPDKNLANKHNQIDSPYKYLNSGGFIGKVGMIKYFLNKMNFNLLFYPRSNQILWMQQYLNHQDLITLDHNCSIFYALVDIDTKDFTKTLTITNNRFFNNITKTQPCHIHFNGNAKMYMTKKLINKFL